MPSLITCLLRLTLFKRFFCPFFELSFYFHVIFPLCFPLLYRSREHQIFFLVLYSFLKSSIFTFLSFYNTEFFNNSYLYYLIVFLLNSDSNLSFLLFIIALAYLCTEYI